jgi:hypothetical protein
MTLIVTDTPKTAPTMMIMTVKTPRRVPTILPRKYGGREYDPLFGEQNRLIVRPRSNTSTDDNKENTVFTVSTTEEFSSGWQQAVASMKQAALDMGINIVVAVQPSTADETTPVGETTADLLRATSADDTINEIVITIPDEIVEATVKALSQNEVCW